MFSRLKIVWKLALLLLVMIGGLAGMSYSNLQSTRTLLIEGRQQELKHILESARSVLQHYNNEQKAGRMNEATARKAAYDTIRTLRYGENDYFFVFDYDGTTRVLGPRPAAEGTDMSGSKDANGVYYVKELIAGARKGGEFLFYQFPKPGQTVASPKMGLGLDFEPWGLMIGTGVYIDDIEEAYAIKKRSQQIEAGGSFIGPHCHWNPDRSLYNRTSSSDDPEYESTGRRRQNNLGRVYGI